MPEGWGDKREKEAASVGGLCTIVWATAGLLDRAAPFRTEEGRREHQKTYG